MTIVSYSREFIFVKTRKVAGTSVEGLLRSICGADDVVTPVSPIDDKVLIDQGLPPRNFANPAHRQSEADYIAKVHAGDFEAALAAIPPAKLTFRNHMTAVQIARRVNRAFWRSAFKFTIERHPYAYVASFCGFDAQLYNQGRLHAADDAELRQRITRWFENGGLAKGGNADFYLDRRDKLLVDFVIRYENLEDGLRQCLESIGVRTDMKLPEFKSVARLTPDRAAALLSDSQRRQIVQAFRRTFDQLGYAL